MKEKSIHLDIYSAEKYGKQVQDYQLKDTTHTGSPESVIDDCTEDSERFPIAILDESDQLVGFFCLHIGAGPRSYGFTDENEVLIRAFSIDDRFRRQGYALSALESLSNFVQEHISPKILKIILAVNQKNISAQKAYEKFGFTKLSRRAEGKKGSLYLMEKAIK